VIYSELYRVLWRRKLVVFAATLVCAALAYAASEGQTKLYTATSTVRVEPAGDASANDRFEASQRLARSYAEIYTQGAVIPSMTRILGPGATPVELEELDAGQVKDLDLLEISGVATDPTRATAIARAGAAALENFSPREELTPITLKVPDGPSSPNVLMNVLLAVFGGFVLSCALVLAINTMQQPISDPEELEREFALPVLAEVPTLKLHRRRAQSRAPQARDEALNLVMSDGAGSGGGGRHGSRGRG
jgi:capsular polysaccharide biosynthesis protein